MKIWFNSFFWYLSHSPWSQISMSQNFPGYYFLRKADCKPVSIFNILFFWLLQSQAIEGAAILFWDLPVVLLFNVTGGKQGKKNKYRRPVLVLQLPTIRQLCPRLLSSMMMNTETSRIYFSGDLEILGHNWEGSMSLSALARTCKFRNDGFSKQLYHAGIICWNVLCWNSSDWFWILLGSAP